MLQSFDGMVVLLNIRARIVLDVGTSIEIQIGIAIGIKTAYIADPGAARAGARADSGQGEFRRLDTDFDSDLDPKEIKEIAATGAG